MTRLAPLVAASLLTASAYAPAVAAPSTTTITITASRSAAMNVRLPRAVQFYLGEPGDDGPAVRIEGGGELAGFLLIPAGRDAVGQLALRRDNANPTYFTAGDPVATLPKGTYRLHVAASAPVTITFTVAGMSRTTWRPTEALATSRTKATWDLPAGTALNGTARVALRKRSVAVFVLDHRMTGQQYSNAVCLTRTPGTCGEAAAWESRTQVLVVGGAQVDRPAGFGTLADRPVAAGAYTARWEIEAAGLASGPTATVYVVG